MSAAFTLESASTLEPGITQSYTPNIFRPCLKLLHFHFCLAFGNFSVFSVLHVDTNVFQLEICLWIICPCTVIDQDVPLFIWRFPMMAYSNGVSFEVVPLEQLSILEWIVEIIISGNFSFWSRFSSGISISICSLPSLPFWYKIWSLWQWMWQPS